MSKKNRKAPQTLNSLADLQVLAAPEPGDEIVAAAIAAFTSIPAVPVLVQVEDMRQEVDKYDAATKDLDDVISRVGSLQAKLVSYKSALKSKILNSGAITNIRVYVESRLGDKLNEIVDEMSNTDPAFARMREELVSLVAKANELSELRQRANELEMEAESLLASLSNPL